MPSAQALGALLLAGAGFVLGLALDFYRVLRRLSNPGRLMTMACDLLFWLVYAVWIFVLLLRISGGEVRYHVFLSIAVGAVAYFQFFSRRLASAWYVLLYRLLRAANRTADLISRAIDFCLMIVLWPYRVIMRYLIRPLWLVIRFLLNPCFIFYDWLQRQLSGFWAWFTRPIRQLLIRLRQALADMLRPPTKES